MPEGHDGSKRRHVATAVYAICCQKAHFGGFVRASARSSNFVRCARFQPWFVAIAHTPFTSRMAVGRMSVPGTRTEKLNARQQTIIARLRCARPKRATLSGRRLERFLSPARVEDGHARVRERDRVLGPIIRAIV